LHIGATHPLAAKSAGCAPPAPPRPAGRALGQLALTTTKHDDSIRKRPGPTADRTNHSGAALRTSHEALARRALLPGSFKTLQARQLGEALSCFAGVCSRQRLLPPLKYQQARLKQRLRQ
jgi:hypothetical protein